MELNEELAPVLTAIFNKSLDSGVVPEDWREANVTPIFKKGKRTAPENYRQVSLTSGCCKLLESVSVADPNPGSGAFLPPGSRIRIRDGAMVGSGSGIS
jgi:hypothetical protein